MSNQQQREETTININHQDDLNRAVILSPSQIQSTPSTKKYNTRNKKMKQIFQQSEEDQQEWRLFLTKSIQQSQKEEEPSTPHPKSNPNNIKIEKTADVKTKSGCKINKLCAICLSEYRQVRGSLQCQHQFCFQCISQWCKTSTICPCCRGPIDSILKLVRSPKRQQVKEMQRVKVQKKQLVVESEYDHYLCYECGLGDNQHVLLICDQCDFYCCHIYCDPSLDNSIPEGDWFCIYCQNRRDQDRWRSNPNHQEIFLTNNQEEKQFQLQSEKNESPDKGVSARTRSRVSFDLSMHNRILTNLRVIRHSRR